MSADSAIPSASDVARNLAAALEARGQEYALGGAIALGFWGEPRGTLDVDVTLFLAPDKPSECLWLLQDIACELTLTESLASLREHGFCRVKYRGLWLDVFLPIVDFYFAAQVRRRRVRLAGQPAMIWDAESLIVFKLMFFRRKDVADVEGILRIQRGRLDLDWVRGQLVGLYGARDPRVRQWGELVVECGADQGNSQT